MCRAWSETPKFRFCHDAARILSGCQIIGFDVVVVYFFIDVALGDLVHNVETILTLNTISRNLYPGAAIFFFVWVVALRPSQQFFSRRFSVTGLNQY